MTAVDTNIVVRFLTGDDPIQFEQSIHIFSTHEVFIPDTVILEAEWVLRYAYEFDSAPNRWWRHSESFSACLTSI